MKPYDPSGATRPPGRVGGNQRGMAGFAAVDCGAWLARSPSILPCAANSGRQPKHRADEERFADKIESDGRRQNVIFGSKIGSAENPHSAEQTECERQNRRDSCHCVHSGISCLICSLRPTKQRRDRRRKRPVTVAVASKFTQIFRQPGGASALRLPGPRSLSQPSEARPILFDAMRWRMSSRHPESKEKPQDREDQA
jgi:hypothetical protein